MPSIMDTLNRWEFQLQRAEARRKVDVTHSSQPSWPSREEEEKRRRKEERIVSRVISDHEVLIFQGVQPTMEELAEITGYTRGTVAYAVERLLEKDRLPHYWKKQ